MDSVMNAVSTPPDGLSWEVLRLVADARRQLEEMRRLLLVNAEVLAECRRLVLTYHPEAARALVDLCEKLAANGA